MLDNKGLYLLEELDERQLKLMLNCMVYGNSDVQGGLPGHNLMLLINNMMRLFGVRRDEIENALEIIERNRVLGNEDDFTEGMKRYIHKCIGLENGCACDLCYNQALEQQLYDNDEEEDGEEEFLRLPVENCAACGTDHYISFTKLPQESDSGDSHIGLCFNVTPSTAVFMRFRTIPEEDDDERLPFDEPVECECCDEQLRKLQYNHLMDDDDWFAESDGEVLLEECACDYCQWQRDKDDIETKTAFLNELHETIGKIVAISGQVLESWDKS